MKTKVTWIALAILLVTQPGLSPAFGEDGMKHESEAGVVITSGNTTTQSFNLKHETVSTWASNLLKGNARYLKSSTGGIETGRSWNIGLRYERALSDRFSLFLGQAIESDPFAGYLQRYNTDLGAKYGIIQEKELTWFAEGGYRFSRENRIVPPNLNNHMLRVYTEATRAWNESFSTKLWVEYLPNLTTSADWQLNSELSLSAVLTSIFSIKAGYLVKYDGLPAGGAKTTDTLFTTALVAKY